MVSVSLWHEQPIGHRGGATKSSEANAKSSTELKLMLPISLAIGGLGTRLAVEERVARRAEVRHRYQVEIIMHQRLSGIEPDKPSFACREHRSASPVHSRPHLGSIGETAFRRRINCGTKAVLLVKSELRKAKPTGSKPSENLRAPPLHARPQPDHE